MEEGDCLLCTVKKVEGTSVFLETELNFPATMVLSEVAAGRIRNLRAYISPNKKIVCKILKIQRDHLEVSLRRVTAKEREDVLEKNQKERTLKSMLSSVVEKPEDIVKEISKDFEVSEFLDEVRESPERIDKYLGKAEGDKFKKILIEKREKKKSVKKIITLKSKAGIESIKEILKFPEVEIIYLGSSKFSIEVSAKDFKEAEREIKSVVDDIKKRSKEKKAFLEVQEKK